MDVIISFLRENKFVVQLLIAILELMIGFALGPFLKNWILKLKPKGVDKGVLTFTGSFVNIFVRFLSIVIALGQIGVNMDVVVGAFSAVGLGVSLALKENMANVAGGLQILITKPFVVGDYISLNNGDGEGTCKQIELMFTTLETVNGQEVIIPNSMLVSNSITNFTENPVRRLAIDIPVSNEGDYQSFREKMQDFLENLDNIHKTPVPTTVITGFTPDGNGMLLRLVAYCSNANYWNLLYAINEEVQKQRTALNLNQPITYMKVMESNPSKSVRLSD